MRSIDGLWLGALSGCTSHIAQKSKDSEVTHKLLQKRGNSKGNRKAMNILWVIIGNQLTIESKNFEPSQPHTTM